MRAGHTKCGNKIYRNGDLLYGILDKEQEADG